MFEMYIPLAGSRRKPNFSEIFTVELDLYFLIGSTPTVAVNNTESPPKTASVD